MLVKGLLLVILHVWAVSADYECLCNYNIEKAVFSTLSDQGPKLGYMYEFDCKQRLDLKNAPTGWNAVAFEHKVGYIQSGSQVLTQTCVGDPPTDDLVPTTTASATVSTTTVPTTQQQTTKTTATTSTTSRPKTTMTTTTTPKPTTTTTPKPTSTTSNSSTKTPKQTTTTTTSTTTTTPKPTTTTSKRTTTTRPTTHLPTATSPSNAGHGNLNACPLHLRHDTTISQGVLLAQYGGSCYEFVPTPVSWSHAEYNCKLNGGHLVTINSASEQNFIYNYLVSNFNHTMWIGLHDQQYEEYFQWTSGESVTYTHWYPYRKSYNHNNEDCAYMVPNGIIQGMWDDIPCGGDGPFTEYFGTKNRYICEYHAHDVATAAPAQGQKGTIFTNDGLTFLCPTSIKNHAQYYGGILAHYKEHCYELLRRTSYTWQHGEQICQANGGHLAHIANSEEQSFIQQFMQRHLPDHAVWIGLSDVDKEGQYRWSSGDPVQYTNWVNNHVGNFVDPGREDCVAFIPYQNGQWDDIACGSHGLFAGDYGEIHPILCEYGTTLSGPTSGPGQTPAFGSTSGSGSISTTPVPGVLVIG